MVDKIVSHYKILEKLGGGGMGVAYKAEDTRLKRTVALKFLPPELTRDPEAKERFIHEAQAASALQHHNICVVYDIDETDEGQMFISMEYIEGETLKKKIERGPLKIDEAVDVAMQVAQGLTKAHEHGIIHRDIKPANIMVTTDGVSKIVDFGLAKLSGRTMLTKTGSTLGTAAYMSPEQARGEPADHRSDIWSLGVVLYEMLTGTRPFEADYENALFYSILNSQPQPPTGLRSGIPLELERIANKALSKLAAERYQHADEMIVDLARLRKEPETQARLQAPATRTPRRLSVSRRTAILAVGFALTILAVIVLWLGRERTEGPSASEAAKSIAVLPLNTAIRTDEDRMFADGIQGEILTQLTKIRSLEVRAQTSVMQYRDTKKRIADIGKELHTDYLVEGGIQKTADRIRIQVQLIETPTEIHIWAETYDQKYTADNIFDIQSAIAQKIAAALRTTLTPVERTSIELKPTENLTAYEYYLRGNYYWTFGLTLEENEKAVEMYEKAVAADPQFALAHARLVQTICTMMQYETARSPGRRDAAKRALERAIALGPELSYTRLAKAYYAENVEIDSARAIEEYRAAVREEPNNSDFRYSLGNFLLNQGEMVEANEQLVKAFHLNPTWTSAQWTIGTYLFLRNLKEAEELCDIVISMAPAQEAGYEWKWRVVLQGFGDTSRARLVIEECRRNTNSKMLESAYCLELWSRNFEAALQMLERDTTINGLHEFSTPNGHDVQRAFVLLRLGQREKAKMVARVAVARMSKAAEQKPENEFLHLTLAFAYAILGRRDDALREARTAAHPGIKLMGNWGRLFDHGVARVHILTGDHDLAISELEHLLSVPSDVTGARLRLDPIYDPLRDNPRFQALLTKTEQM
jgi:TolB-like protein/Flp pilus assembly protein TadD/predicted Ser/Thr protein kinase